MFIFHKKNERERDTGTATPHRNVLERKHPNDTQCEHRIFVSAPLFLQTLDAHNGPLGATEIYLNDTNGNDTNRQREWTERTLRT